MTQTTDGLPEPPEAAAGQLRCAAPWWRVAAYTALAVAGAAAAALGSLDGPGRLLLAVAAAGVAALAARDAVLRPTLRADAAGLDVVDGLRRLRVAWPDVHRVSAETANRRGLVHLRTLELDLRLDGEDHLVVLSRRALADDPSDVAVRLRRLQAAADG